MPESIGYSSYTLRDYYLTSVAVGLRSLKGRYRREAAARMVNPLSYPRYLEYRFALDGLGPSDGCTILDIGSPKLPALLIARDGRTTLHTTDIRDYFIGPVTHFLTRMGLAQQIGRRLFLETQDARCLTYSDAAFDRVYSISVLEHIPDDGDSRAMQEIARVLRPGGVVTLTVPFTAGKYWEEHVRGDVYERRGNQTPTFYQRHYDSQTLQDRLIEPSGLHLVDAVFFGEPGPRFEPYWNRIPMHWKLPLLWAQPFLAGLFLKPLRMDQMDAACGVALKLTKENSR